MIGLQKVIFLRNCLRIVSIILLRLHFWSSMVTQSHQMKNQKTTKRNLFTVASWTNL